MTLKQPRERYEQLQLFEPNESSTDTRDIPLEIIRQQTKRDALAAILADELDFHNEDSGYASHNLHAFAAKFPPQIPRIFIRRLTDPGDRVLDPMMGSGTAIVEALLEGRQGIGLDIDPLALHLTQTKTQILDSEILFETTDQIITSAYKLLEDEAKIDRLIDTRFDTASREFIDYWFLPATQRELMALHTAIQETTDGMIKRFFDLAFSSIIITKSGGVSLARDLAHTRPHRDNTKTPKNALEQFKIRARKNIKSIAQMPGEMRAEVVRSDARAMPFTNCSIDLIVTSPPYANAIDYMRAHKFSLVWFGKPIKELSELRAQYIGSERIGDMPATELPDKPRNIIAQLDEVDPKKSKILRKYYVEMSAAIAEMYRVLRYNSATIIVVASSTMRNIDVQTHECLADIAAQRGFDVVGIAERKLDRNKRMMPARFGKKSNSGIEHRMHNEYVLGLFKVASPPSWMFAN